MRTDAEDKAKKRERAKRKAKAKDKARRQSKNKRMTPSVHKNGEPRSDLPDMGEAWP